jgi:hypothetical protein
VPDALGRLRSRLEAQRRAGVGFADAWQSALAELRGGGRGLDRWRGAVESTRSAWQRAYERRPPTPREQAVALALAALREWDAERAERERFEPLPGLPLPSAPVPRQGNGTGRGARPKLAPTRR